MLNQCDQTSVLVTVRVEGFGDVIRLLGFPPHLCIDQMTQKHICPSVCVLQIFVPFFVLHRLWFFSLSQPVLLVQLLLQPLLTAQLLQRQPLQVIRSNQENSAAKVKDSLKTNPTSAVCKPFGPPQ